MPKPVWTPPGVIKIALYMPADGFSSRGVHRELTIDERTLATQVSVIDSKYRYSNPDPGDNCTLFIGRDIIAHASNMKEEELEKLYEDFTGHYHLHGYMIILDGHIKGHHLVRDIRTLYSESQIEGVSPAGEMTRAYMQSAVNQVSSRVAEAPCSPDFKMGMASAVEMFSEALGVELPLNGWNRVKIPLFNPENLTDEEEENQYASIS